MKTKKNVLIVIGIMGLTATALQAQIAINNSAANPDASAILDLNTGNAGVNKGLLAPQVALTNIAIAAPVVTPATGLMVYSTTAPAGGNGKGYYYWNGTAWSSLNNTTYGSGTNNYVARWTPNTSTLGTGMIQDNGSSVSIDTVPIAGNMLYVNSPTGSGIEGYSKNYAGVTGRGDNFYGIEGYSANATGVYGEGGNYGVYGYTLDLNGSYAGVYGQDDNNIGVYGYSRYAIGGYFKDGGGDYVYLADNVYRNGVTARAQTYGGELSDLNGDYGAIGDGNNGCAASFMNSIGTYMYVCKGGSGYITNGSKSTVVKDKNNQERLLFCNESPEVMFEDYGEGQLVNGKAHIALDSLFAMNVTINEKHPLRVYIELLGDCNGTYVTNRSASGFDVCELNHGTSNTAFQWHIVCNRANEAGEGRDYAEKRFPVGPAAPKNPAMATEKNGIPAPSINKNNTAN